MDERRGRNDNLMPGQHVVPVPGAASVNTSITGYGVVVLRGKK